MLYNNKITIYMSAWEEIQLDPGQTWRGAWSLTAQACLWPAQACGQVLTQAGAALKQQLQTLRLRSRDWSAQKDFPQIPHLTRWTVLPERGSGNSVLPAQPGRLPGVHRQEERPGPPAPPHPVLSPDLVFPDPLVLQETPSCSEKTVQQMPSPFSWPTEGLQPRKVHWLCKWLGHTALTTGPALCHPEGLSPQKTCIITN